MSSLCVPNFIPSCVRGINILPPGKWYNYFGGIDTSLRMGTNWKVFCIAILKEATHLWQNTNTSLKSAMEYPKYEHAI